MKKLLFILFVSFCTTICKVNAQVLKPNSSIGGQITSAESLLLQSKKQKKRAWTLLGAGAGVVIAGYIVAENAIDYNDPSTLLGIGSTQAKTGTIIGFAGGVMMLGSIPFFIISGKNRREASLIIRNENNFKETNDNLFRLLNFTKS